MTPHDLKDSSDRCFNLGIQSASEKDLDGALSWYSQSIEFDPNNLYALNNIGAIMKDRGQILEAISFYERALEVDPEFQAIKSNLAIALNDMGSLTHQKGNTEEAFSLFRKALFFNPTLSDASYNLGVVCAQVGMRKEAIEHYKAALHCCPSSKNALNNLGALYKEQAELDLAAELYKRSLQIDPHFTPANNNLAVIYSLQGQVTKAMECLERAMKDNPNYGVSFNVFGSLLRDQGRSAEAVPYFRKAYNLSSPASFDSLHNVLLVLNDIPEMDNKTIFETHCRYGKIVSNNRPKIPNLLENRNLDLKRVLKIGYVSSDFNTHAVSYFAEVLLSHSDPKNSQVFVYYNNPTCDSTTKRLKQYGHKWTQIEGKSSLEVANIIRQDEIDFLVDLAGHTGGNRLDVFTHKPAPIQVTWIGYPNTTGIPEIDYRFTDSLADPLDTLQNFTEKLVRLPGCFLCYTPAPTHPSSVSLSPFLKNGFITFGSFNNFGKVSKGVKELWAKILNLVPNSRLLMKCKGFADPNLVDNVKKMMKSYGIEESRLELCPHKSSIIDHLEYYSKMDISLDTFPYAGTTTTVESLFMGVPGITLKGYNHAHNVGVSLLSRVPCMKEFVSETPEKYVENAVLLANDRKKLIDLRGKLREEFLASELCDRNQFMGNVNRTYRELWQSFVSNNQ